MSDDLETARLRRAGRRSRPVDGTDRAATSMVARILSTGTAIGSRKFVRVREVAAFGAEVEGQAGTTPDLQSTVLVALLGTQLPSVGDLVVCHFVANRWVAEFAGVSGQPPAGSVQLPTCFCLTPYTLAMASAEPLCNYGMFQNCTLQYGPPPPAMQTTGTTDNVHTSLESFVDPITRSSFFYYFWCQYNQYFLTRIFPTSPFGSPYRDGILYSWITGNNGNTCEPFQLTGGSPFPGSDTYCNVDISGAATQVTPPETSP